MKYYARRIPKPNPNLANDPIWPGDPFWRSKKYSRELRAKVAHEYHHSPDQPNFYQLSVKHNVPMSSMVCWIYAYPFGSRPMPDRTYRADGTKNYARIKERAEAMAQEYAKELRAHSPHADPTWWLMGDPLPSRNAAAKCGSSSQKKKISLPFVPVVFTIGNDV